MYDVVIVGGGPAGLSAALILGRCRRRVLVCDEGRPRNAPAREIHGFFTRDAVAPNELLRLGREEIQKYGVEFAPVRVASARCLSQSDHPNCGRFEVSLEDGRTFRSRRLLLATGVRDVLPQVEGIEDFYGRSVHHCPYCDGWEHRDRRLVSLGTGVAASGLALSLLTWSKHVTACTQGGRLTRHERSQIHDSGVVLREERVVRFEGSAGGVLERIVFESGPDLECDAVFFNSAQLQHSSLPSLLGCNLNKDGQVRTHGKQRTDVAGLFLAGDADGDVQFAVVAAAEGARAAVAINRELQEEAHA